MSDDIPANYYSLWFEENDINNKEEIIIYEHDNNINVDESFIKMNPNYFLTRKDAEDAREAIWKILCKGNVIHKVNNKWVPTII